MKNLFLPVILATLVGLLAGCVSTSRILDVGKDTYSTSATAGAAFVSKAREEAFEAAKKHCASLGKEFMLVSETRSGDPIATVIITFRALDKNDPEYKRPNVQQSPAVVIEDRRK